MTNFASAPTPRRHPRILLAGIAHETNTFWPGTAGDEEFSVSRGNELLKHRADGSCIGAFFEEADRNGWVVIPSIYLRGVPGPCAGDPLVRTFFETVEDTASRESPIDALFLVLHGAMVTAAMPDVEGEFLERISRHPALAGKPVFGTLDLHANFTLRMAEHSNGLLTYRENPHTDAADTARRAARLLAWMWEGGRTLKTRHVPTPIVWPPTGTATAVDPMRGLEALARSEECEGVMAVNVFAGFAHADIPETGVSFSIVYDEERVGPEKLRELALRLEAKAVSSREMGVPQEWALEHAIDDALEKKLFPVCLVEPSDNIGGGAPGDGTAILRALLARKLRGGVILNDPAAVKVLQNHRAGDEVELEIGGKIFPSESGPVPVKACLIRLTDGCFQLEDLQSHSAGITGTSMHMGDCAVLECEGTTILLTSERTAPFDLGQWRSQGVDPSSLTFIGVKAAVAHRQAYDRIASASYWVRTPGPCSNDLRSLVYRRIRRPVFPLDQLETPSDHSN